MPRLPAEIADYLPAGLRSSQVRAHVLMPQPEGSAFAQLCVVLHGEVPQLLVRASAEEEFHAFPLAAEGALEASGEGDELKLVLRTEAGDRHPLVASDADREALEALLARVPAPAADEAEQGASDEEGGEAAGEEEAGDNTPEEGEEEEEEDPLATVAELLLAGTFDEALEHLGELAERRAEPALADLKRVLRAFEGGDLEAAAFIFLELRSGPTELDAVVAQLLAPAVEDAGHGPLALQCYGKIESHDAVVERARLLRLLEDDEEELDEAYSRQAVGYLRRHLSRHSDDATARERLGLHLLAQGELDMAVQELERAIELDGNRWGARHTLIRAFGELERGDDAQAQREALVLRFEPRPSSAPALIEGVALTALRVGRMDRAGELLAELRGRLGDVGEVGYEAQLALELEELEEAMNLLRDGRHHEAALCALFWWEHLGDGLEELCELLGGHFEASEAGLSAALYSRVEGGRERHEGLFRQIEGAGALERQELHRRALEVLDGALSGSETASALRYRAIVADARLESEEAADLAVQAVERDGDDLLARLTLLRILEENFAAELEAAEEEGGEAAEADLEPSEALLSCIDAGLEKAPGHPRLLRALAHYGADAERALAATGTLIGYDPRDRDAFEVRARLLRQLGRLDQLAAVVAHLVALGGDDLEMVARARQALDDEAQSAARGESSPWLKIVIAVGVAAAIALLIWKSSGN